MSLLDQLFGSGIAGALRAASRLLPGCAVCGEPAVLRCCRCAEPVCHQHAFVCAGPPLQAVCRPCSGIEEPHGEGAEEEWPYAEPPWVVLGVTPNAAEDEVRAAYRRASKSCHPDHGGAPGAQVQINAAYEAMLARARARAA